MKEITMVLLKSDDRSIIQYFKQTTGHLNRMLI